MYSVYVSSVDVRWWALQRLGWTICKHTLFYILRHKVLQMF